MFLVEISVEFAAENPLEVDVGIPLCQLMSMTHLKFRQRAVATRFSLFGSCYLNSSTMVSVLVHNKVHNSLIAVRCERRVVCPAEGPGI
jgi:hypothetical protein